MFLKFFFYLMLSRNYNFLLLQNFKYLDDVHLRILKVFELFNMLVFLDLKKNISSRLFHNAFKSL